MRYENILQAIGRTPLIRIQRMAAGVPCPVYLKCDNLNPGGSVKDRIGISMIDDAERRGLLKPGGTIIEGTSGNTGVGLALVAAVRGYKIIFTITDKQSQEKINLLKAFGAEVIVCPTAVAPDDPRSYYSVAKKLAREIPNSYYPNQYDNPMNPEAHYRSTGPEIWEDSEGRITHFIAGMGTGGTICGVARYLKEKNPKVRVVGVDPIGSLYYEFFHKGKIGQAHTYKVEGIGEDIFPKCMDFAYVDDVLQVNDQECFVTARKLARMEGIFAGGSTGAAVSAGLRYARGLTEKDFVVIFIPDSGSRNLSKIYNDEWMRQNQFLEPDVKITAEEILRKKSGRALLTVQPSATVYDVLQQMKAHDISQMPVFEEGVPIGALYDDKVVDLVLAGKDLKSIVVREAMGKPFPVVAKTATVDQISAQITAQTPAVFVEVGPKKYDIITKYDLVQAIAEV